MLKKIIGNNATEKIKISIIDCLLSIDKFKNLNKKGRNKVKNKKVNIITNIITLNIKLKE